MVGKKRCFALAGNAVSMRQRNTLQRSIPLSVQCFAALSSYWRRAQVYWALAMHRVCNTKLVVSGAVISAVRLAGSFADGFVEWSMQS